ncbi:VC0807 family protein [Solibacillus isronensis]|uniref:VC0807 family protein n=1 Tax=Solibacillus isronensis TaxID=412383 RepID=UPI0009A7B543|nr:VC0807 family protein [Solibacillus isronensis]
MANNSQSNKYLILLDLLFYAALPYAIWKFGREPFGDYVAMLLSTVPGIIYTVYRFAKDRQFNVTGLFILGSMLIGTTVDLLSGSAEQMIWNNVYLGLFYTFLYVILFIIKKPFPLYVAIDFAYLQGYARKDSKTLFFQKGIFGWFQLIQLVFIVRGLVMAGITVFLLRKYGIDSYGDMLIYKRVASWVFSGILTGMFFYISVVIQKYTKRLQEMNEQKIQEPEIVTE